MNPNAQQHRNNLGISEANSSNDELERLLSFGELGGRFSQMNILRHQLLQNLTNRTSNLEPFLSPSLPTTPPGSPRRQFLDSEPRPTTALNAAAIPYSPPVYDNSALPPRNPNLPGNLFQYSPSHDNLQYRFGNAQSPDDHYCNYQTNSGRCLINSPTYDYRHGNGSSGSRHREIYSPQLYPGRNLGIYPEAGSNNVESAERRLVRAQLQEKLHRLDRIEKQLLELADKLTDKGYNLDTFLTSKPKYSLQPRRQFLGSEPVQRMGFNAAAMPENTPYNSPIAGADNGIHIKESPSFHYPPSSRNLNLRINLPDDGSNQRFHYSSSHDSLQYSRFANSESPNDCYCYPHPDHHVNSTNRNNGIGLYSLQRISEISSPQPNNADYDVNGGYHDHDEPFTLMNVVRGNVLVEAKNQEGSRFLLDKLSHGSAKDIDMVFSEVKRGLCSLMMHQFGHQVVQKLIDVVDDWKLDEILLILTSDLREFGQVCADVHGTKVVQKLVGRLGTPERQSLLALPMCRIVLLLTKSNTSSEVIYECLNNFSPIHKKLLLRAVVENCLDIAKDKFGCCALQKCFDHADDEIFNHLTTPIVQNADTLSEDSYANYVVQHVIIEKNLEVNRHIVAKLKGNFVSLSMNKYGSNVVEKLLTHSGLEEVANTVITEILESSSLLRVSHDLMGNFVVQAAIKVIKEGPLFNRLRKHIKDNEKQLRNRFCGRIVLKAMNERKKATDKRINERIIRNI